MQRFGGTLLLSFGLIAYLGVFVSIQRERPLTFVIPDERAAHTVGERIAHGIPPAIDDPLAQEMEGILHPRSMTVTGGRLVPEGFPFLSFLYGWVMRFIPWEALPYVLLPLSTVGAAAGLWFLIGRTTRDQSLAQWCAGLYPFLPPVLYYSFHPYLNNLLQVNLMIVGGAMIGWAIDQGKFVGRAMGGIFGIVLGIALSLRPNEVWWIAMLIVVLFTRAGIWRKRGMIAMVGLGAIVPLIVLADLHHSLYGAWWKMGYAFNPIIGDTDSVFMRDATRSIRASLFPFGFSIAGSIQRFWEYELQPFWWFSIVILLGVATMRGGTRSTLRTWKILALFVSAWLIVYYGSWGIREQADPTIHPISAGSVRYWIPIWIGALPWIATGIQSVVGWAGDRFRPAMISIALAAMVISPTWATLSSITDHLSLQRDQRKRLARLIAVTPENAVIVVKYSDKVYFPTRRVMVWYQEPEKARRILPNLINRVPVYLDSSSDEGTAFDLPLGVIPKETILIAPDERLLRLDIQRL